MRIILKLYVHFLIMCKFDITVLLADATISLITPTSPVHEDAGDVQMCCAQLTDLPVGGLGCPLIATLNLTDGSKAGTYVSWMHAHLMTSCKLLTELP